MRRPRPTLAEMDALRDTVSKLEKQHSVLFADYQKLFYERNSLLRTIDTLQCDRKLLSDERNVALAAVSTLRPIGVAELFRILWNGIRGKGWGRVAP